MFDVCVFKGDGVDLLLTPAEDIALEAPIEFNRIEEETDFSFDLVFAKVIAGRDDELDRDGCVFRAWLADWLFSVFRINEDGDWAIVGETDLHVGTESASLAW